MARIVFLQNTAYNDAMDEVEIVQTDREENHYYFDNESRWCYVTPREENIIWVYGVSDSFSIWAPCSKCGGDLKIIRPGDARCPVCEL